jgi:hypothetical protein
LKFYDANVAKKYYCKLLGNSGFDVQCMRLAKREVEALEYDLLSSGKANADDIQPLFLQNIR